MQYEIIRATGEHLIACAAILAHSDIGRVYFDTEQEIWDSLAVGIASEEVYVAADRNTNCMGFIWFVYKASFHSFPYLHIIAVDERHRGRGIGRALLAFYEDLIFPEYSKTFLVVADFNPRARQLYERLGYQKVGEIPGLYRKGITEYLMMKARPENP